MALHCRLLSWVATNTAAPVALLIVATSLVATIPASVALPDAGRNPGSPADPYPAESSSPTGALLERLDSLDVTIHALERRLADRDRDGFDGREDTAIALLRQQLDDLAAAQREQSLVLNAAIDRVYDLFKVTMGSVVLMVITLMAYRGFEAARASRSESGLGSYD